MLLSTITWGHQCPSGPPATHRAKGKPHQACPQRELHMGLGMPAAADTHASLGRKERLTEEMEKGTLGSGTPNQVN